MIKKPKNLLEIRNAIDKIDVEIINLLKQRSMYIPFVREIKKDLDAKIAFAREGQMGHKLLKDDFGNYSNIYMQRIWRELIMATLFIEGPFIMAILQEENINRYIALREISLAHFSFNTKINPYQSTKSALNAVLNNQATVAIFDKESSHHNKWWVELYENEDYRQIKLNLTLPFIKSVNDCDVTGFCCSKGKIEPTGNDVSFFVFNDAKLKEFNEGYELVDKYKDLNLITVKGFTTSKQQGFFIGTSVTKLPLK